MPAGEVDGFFPESDYIAVLGGARKVLGGACCVAADAEAVPVAARGINEHKHVMAGERGVLQGEAELAQRSWVIEGRGSGEEGEGGNGGRISWGCLGAMVIVVEVVVAVPGLPL